MSGPDIIKPESVAPADLTFSMFHQGRSSGSSIEKAPRVILNGTRLCRETIQFVSLLSLTTAESAVSRVNNAEPQSREAISDFTFAFKPPARIPAAYF